MTDNPPPPPVPLEPDPALAFPTRGQGGPDVSRPQRPPVSSLARPRAEGPTVKRTTIGMVVAIVALTFLVGVLSGYLAGTEGKTTTEVDQLRGVICRLLDEVGADSTGPADRELCTPGVMGN